MVNLLTFYVLGPIPTMITITESKNLPNGVQLKCLKKCKKNEKKCCTVKFWGKKFCKNGTVIVSFLGLNYKVRIQYIYLGEMNG